MAVYPQYIECRARYAEAKRRYAEILTEKEELFQRTQPQAVQFDRERVGGGSPSNKFEEYVIAKESKRLDERLYEARSIAEDRERLLRMKEKELRASGDVRDKVYFMRYLDRMKVYRIARAVNYSEPQIYRILREIRKHDRK